MHEYFGSFFLTATIGQVGDVWVKPGHLAIKRNCEAIIHTNSPIKRVRVGVLK